MRKFAVVALLAGPAQANPDLIAYLGGHGCTIGTDSRAAAMAAGFTGDQIDALINESLETGTASQQGAYVVLDAATCTIRLPDIASELTVATPEIAAQIERIADGGFDGCYLRSITDWFRFSPIVPDGTRTQALLAFYANGIISGDLRFFSPDPLSTPPAFRVMTGACGEGSDTAAVDRTHAFIARDFGTYIRQMGAELPCGVDGYPRQAVRQTMERQLADGPDSPVNAMLDFEFNMIAFAAGWREGMSETASGTPRPPLCHYQ